MEHLTPEALARLVDERPTAAERVHLDACPVCDDELEALRRQSEALTRLPDLRPFAGDFEALEARLAQEGLLAGAGRPRGAGRASARPWIGRTAAVAAFAAGALAGAAVVARVQRAPATSEAAAAGRPSADAALARIEQAERDYVAALAEYRRMTGGADAEETASDPARYAALEQMVRAGRAAVRQAPADPFLNGLLASALAEQQAVARPKPLPETGQDGWF